MKITLLAIVATLAIGSAASAATITYTAVLNAANEATFNSSTATGFATVIVDNVADSMSVQISFSGLTGNATASHIHCCTASPGTGTAAVVIPFPGFPASTSGTYSNSFTGISVANINGIAAGDSYVNIHTAANPGGEIRGFLTVATPEPATFGLVGLLGAVGLLARRRAVRL